MRVAMISYSLYEADNRVRRYAESLVRRNHTVDVVSIGRPGDDAFYRLKGVNVYQVQFRDYSEKAKIQYASNILSFMARSFFFITKRHLSEKYDFVHVHSVPDFLVLAAAVPKMLRCRIILDIHDIVPELYVSKFGLQGKTGIYKMLLLIEKASALFADHVIVANHLWHEKLVSRSIEKGKCSVIMNYPDDDLFSRAACTIPEKTSDTFTLLYPGTLSIHQGIETVLLALDDLRGRIPGLKFKLYGKGTDESYLRGLVADKGLSDIVSFCGLIPIDKIPEAMAEADVGIEPKLSNGFADEAFSTKILEFMMVGVPVIASDTTVHKHYIPDTCVLFYKSGDHHELAEAIFRLYSTPDLKSQLLQASREFVTKRTWVKGEQEYFDILENLGGRV